MNESEDSVPKVYLYITVVEDNTQLYFGILVNFKDKVYLLYEKFQWDKEWLDPPVNIDVSDKTLPSEIKKEIGFDRS